MLSTNESLSTRTSGYLHSTRAGNSLGPEYLDYMNLYEIAKLPTSATEGLLICPLVRSIALVCIRDNISPGVASQHAPLHVTYLSYFLRLNWDWFRECTGQPESTAPRIAPREHPLMPRAEQGLFYFCLRASTSWFLPFPPGKPSARHAADGTPAPGILGGNTCGNWILKFKTARPCWLRSRTRVFGLN